MIHLLKLLQGIGVGVALAAPVDSIAYLCMQQTLAGGFVLGLASSLGAATADTLYGIIIALGIAFLQTYILMYKTSLTVAAGAALCVLGIKKFWFPPALHITEKPVNSTPDRSYIVALLLTLTHPLTLVAFASLYIGFNVDFIGYAEPVIFTLGVFIGAISWWLLLSVSVSIFRKNVSLHLLQLINYGAALVLISFGLYILSQCVYGRI